MRLTPEQRLHLLHLHHVDAASITLIVRTTGLADATVRRVIAEATRQDVDAVLRAAAMRPSSQRRIERAMRTDRATSKEASHDRT